MYMIQRKCVIHDHVCAQLDALGGGGAPLLAAGIGVADVKRLWHKLNDRIFYDDILPPTGSQQISFARLLQLLADRRVKRITMLSDGKVAIVEVTCIVDFLSLALCLCRVCWQECGEAADHGAYKISMLSGDGIDCRGRSCRAGCCSA